MKLPLVLLAAGVALAARTPARADAADRPPDEDATALADDEVVLEAVAPGVAGVLVLRDGRTFEGRVLELGTRRLQWKLPDRSLAEVPNALVRGVLRTELPRGALGGRTAVRVVLADGRVLAAERTEAAGETLVLVSGETRRAVPAADVRAIVPLHEERRPIALAAQHMGAPSAFLPDAGEVLVATRLTQASATGGLFGVAALQAGSTLPAQLTRGYGANAQVSLRAGLPILSWLRAAVGLHADLSRAGYVLAASATATAGTPTAHLTLHAGPVPRGANRLADGIGETGVALAGSLAVGQRFDLLAEGWLSRKDGTSAGLAIAAARLRAGRIALEVGAGRSFPDGDLFPWLAAAVDVTSW
jgi:hypothetical protein